MGVYGLGWTGADGKKVGAGGRSESFLYFWATAQDRPDSRRLFSRHNAAISQGWLSRGCVKKKENGFVCDW